MIKEIFDRENENDQVIGTTSKEEAHANGHIHRIAAVYVFDKEGKLLVQLWKKDGLLDHSAAGHMRQGESYDDGAVRELKEELGISRNNLNKIGVFYSDERFRTNKQIIHYFGVYETELGVDTIVKEESEVIDMIPMMLEEIVNDMNANFQKYTSGFIMTINFYIRNKKLAVPLVQPR